MHVRRWMDYGIDVAAVGIAAAVSIIVIGRALDSGPARSADSLPVVGQVLAGVRDLWSQVYDPAGQAG